jgi:hypothetical protein
VRSFPRKPHNEAPFRFGTVVRPDAARL